MKSSHKQLFRNRGILVRDHPDTSGKAAYLKPADISPKKAAKILSRLNSFDSAEQLKRAILKHTNKMVLTTGDAQRILRSKAESGEFQDLRHVAAVQKIGVKKFDFIVRTLSN